MKKGMKIFIIIFSIILALSISLLGIYLYIKSNKIVTTITLDINPSIKISLNEKDKVVKVEGLNKDGKELVKDNKLKGETLKESLIAISDLVIKKEYINEEKTHILINIEGKKLEGKVSDILKNNFKEKKIECEVWTQKISESSKENAEKYGITQSKASYIEDIIESNKEIKFEELKDKSIDEINDYLDELEEKRKQEEEKKRIEEEKKKQEEEQKKNQTQSSSSSGTGIVALCSSVQFNLENDDAGRKAFEDLGLDFSQNIWYDYQTVVRAYNNMCTYQTMLIYNKQKYTYYHNVTDGSLIYKTSETWLAGNYQDVQEVVVNYFVNNYGATRDQVSVPSSGGTINETTKEATAQYNGNTYDLVIDQKTGEVISIVQQ